MFKMRFRTILSVFLIIACCGLVGCNLDNDLSLKESVDLFSYDQYLKKIWIVKDRDTREDLFRPSSFYITKIENGIIEGKFSTNEVAEPDCYQYSFNPQKDWCDLIGTVDNGVAKCQFSGESGYRGNIELVFKENNEVEATIEYIEQKYEEYYLNGNFIFRPYNLTDFQYSLNPIKTRSFKTDLNYWGNVNFVTVIINGNKPYPKAFLTNDNDDILYCFNAYQVGSEIIDVIIEDINGDGLKDVKMTISLLDFEYDSIYLQMKNGLFYSSNLDEE